MKKLLLLLNCIIFASTYSVNYYNYNITTEPFKVAEDLALDTLGTNYNGYSFNLTTTNDFGINFNRTTDYINPVYSAFRNLKFTGNDKNNINNVSLRGKGGVRVLNTQRIDLENVKLQPDQLEVVLIGDDGNSYLNMKNSELDLSVGKLTLKPGNTFYLNIEEGDNIIGGWQYTSQSAMNININPNSELKFQYGGLTMKEKSILNIDHGKFIIFGNTSKFLMKDSSSQVNMDFGEIQIVSSDVEVQLQNLNSNWGKILIDGNNALLNLDGTTTLNDSSIAMNRGTIDIDTANMSNTGILLKSNTLFNAGILNTTNNIVIDNTQGGNFNTTFLTINNGSFIYKGTNDSSNSQFGTTKINNGTLEFAKDNHIGGKFILNSGNLKFNNNTIYGEINGNGGTISGSVSHIGSGFFGVNLSGSTYVTNIKSNTVVDLSNNLYQADQISSDTFINNFNNIVVEGDSVNAKDYENKKFTVANAPTITGSKNIIHGSTLPALVDFDVVDDSSVSDQDVTLVGKLKPTSSLANHSSVTTNNSGSSQSNAQQVVNILPPTTTSGNQPPLTPGAQKLQSALLTMTNAQVSQNLNSLHAEPYSSHLTIGLEQSDLFLNMVMDHAAPRGDVYHSKAEKSSREIVPETQNNIWVDTAYVSGDVDGEDGLGDFSYRLTNVIVGGDVYEKGYLTLGIYGGYGYHKMDEHDSVTQEFETDTYHIGTYGNYRYDNWVFTGMFGYAYGRNETEREVTVGTSSGKSGDKFDSHSFYTGFRGAYPIKVTKNTTLTPNAGISYSYIYQEEVKESGFDMADLVVDSADADSFITSVGLHIEYEDAIGATPIKPMAFIRYEHDWSANDDSSHEVDAAFRHTPDAKTTFSGQNRGENLVLVGAGMEVEVTPSLLVGGGVSYSDDSNGKEKAIGFNFEYLWD